MTPARVAGTVTGGGQPLEGASVEITGAGERSLTTDADGAYSVRLEAGDYTLTVSQYGFVTRPATSPSWPTRPSPRTSPWPPPP